MLALVFAAAVQLVLQPASRLWIEGDSNLRTWSCEAALEATARARTAEAGTPPLVDSLHVSVPVDGLRCGDAHMDDKLREALQSARFPRIEYALGAVEVLPGALAGERRLKATGFLRVAGVTRTVTLVVRASASPEGKLVARGNLALEMSSFGVDPPTAFLGLLRCRDRLVIRFDLEARAVPLPDAPATRAGVSYGVPETRDPHARRSARPYPRGGGLAVLSPSRPTAQR